MAFRLPLDQDLDDSVRQTAREELAEAVRLLRDDYEDDPVTAIHDARKNLKKTRALLRLVRSGLDADVRRRENAEIRDAARLISGARDSDVMLETVDRLAKRDDSRVSRGELADLRSRLDVPAAGGGGGGTSSANGDADDPGHPEGGGSAGGGSGGGGSGGGGSGGEREGEDGGGPAAVIEALEAVLARIDDWPLDCDWPKLGRGVSRAYRLGRDAFVEADVDPTTDRLHDWRKRVKDIWYHQRLLSEAWPEVFGVQAEAAHLLSELLGDDHDLGVLAERLTGPGDAAILELVGDARTELLRDARRLGRRVYAETGAAFATRIGTYLENAAAEAARDASV